MTIISKFLSLVDFRSHDNFGARNNVGVNACLSLTRNSDYYTLTHQL